MAYPPLEGNSQNTLASSSGPTATLTITETLVVADGRGAQLAVCTITPKTPHQPAFEAVAKIFDALYYPFESRDAAHVACNSAKMADVDYSHEAAALNHLDKMGQTGSSATPKYFGSWTFSLPIIHAGKKLERSVRLVLMEYIKAPSIWSVCRDPAALSRYTEQNRLDILARVLDGVVRQRQRHAGVDQRDLASRNVVLRSSSSSSSSSSSPSAGDKQPDSLPQPVIVDYNIAVVFELSRRGKEPFQFAKLPENPMEVFWHTSFAEFAGWAPVEWNGSLQHSQKWLKERFGGESASQYAPVSVVLEFARY